MHRLDRKIVGISVSALVHVVILLLWASSPTPRHVTVPLKLVWLELLPPAPAEVPKPQAVVRPLPAPPRRPRSTLAPALPALATIESASITAPAPVSPAEPTDQAIATRETAPAIAASIAAVAPRDYAAQLAARLAQVKRYPEVAETAHQQGVVLVFFTLDRRGNVLSWRIQHGSGHAALDAEITEMMASAAPFPPFPQAWTQLSASFLVPVEFSLR